MPSFDVVSEVDHQEVRNAVDQAQCEIATRFDFKNTNSSIEQNELVFTLRTISEDRLSALVQLHGTAPFHQLRDEILSAISTFVGPAEQQDDMTMLLLRVETVEAAAA